MIRKTATLLARIFAYVPDYEIVFVGDRFQYLIVISKDDIELYYKKFKDPMLGLTEALNYLNRINKKL